MATRSLFSAHTIRGMLVFPDHIGKLQAAAQRSDHGLQSAVQEYRAGGQAEVKLAERREEGLTSSQGCRGPGLELPSLPTGSPDHL